MTRNSKRLALAASTFALAIAGCGGDDSDDQAATPPPDDRPAATQTETGTEAAPEAPAAGTPGEAELEETLVTWYAEKDCDAMTERFLDALTPGSKGDPREAMCKDYKQGNGSLTFDPDTLVVSGVQIDGEVGRARMKRKGTSEDAAYELIVEGGEWKVDANCRTRPECAAALGLD